MRNPESDESVESEESFKIEYGKNKSYKQNEFYLRLYQIRVYSWVLQLVSRVPFRRNAHQRLFKTVDYFDDFGHQGRY